MICVSVLALLAMLEANGLTYTVAGRSIIVEEPTTITVWVLTDTPANGTLMCHAKAEVMA